MGQFPDEGLLAKVEGQAIDMAREAGAILSRYFGKPLDVEYKDKHEQDPVTAADKDSQEYLEQAISEAFPDHGVLGEEDREREREDTPLPDFLWVLDPLDGTKNFLSGLPIYACSVGVLYHGNPVVGAVFLPWPGDGAGAVLHARRGGGAFMDREPISVSPLEEPKANSLVTVPGSFGANFRFRKPMRGRIGEMRVTGSIAYELAMTARGVLQYSVTTGPHLWDVAAGIVLVLEAGGIAMWRKRGGGVKSLFGSSPVGACGVPRPLVAERPDDREGIAAVDRHHGAGEPWSGALRDLQHEAQAHPETPPGPLSPPPLQAPSQRQEQSPRIDRWAD